MNSKIRIYTKYLIIDKQIRTDNIKNIKNSKNCDDESVYF